jgi:hypothetical protein
MENAFNDVFLRKNLIIVVGFYGANCALAIMHLQCAIKPFIG